MTILVNPSRPFGGTNILPISGPPSIRVLSNGILIPEFCPAIIRKSISLLIHFG
jgi:hypothetical protein